MTRKRERERELKLEKGSLNPEILLSLPHYTAAHRGTSGSPFHGHAFSPHKPRCVPRWKTQHRETLMLKETHS